MELEVAGGLDFNMKLEILLKSWLKNSVRCFGFSLSF